MSLRIQQMPGPILTLPTSHQVGHFSASLIDRDPRLESTNDRQKVRTAAAWVRWIELKRKQELYGIIAAWRKGEVARQHANNGCRLSTHLDLFTNDVAGATER